MACYLDESGELRCVVGTPFYMAPELLVRSSHNEKIDVWALGCVLLCMCLPRPDLERLDLLCVVAMWGEAKMAAALEAVLEKGFSPALVGFILRLLDPNVKTRPSAAALLNDPYVVAPPKEGGARPQSAGRQGVALVGAVELEEVA